MGRVEETSRDIGSTVLSGPKLQKKGALVTETTRSLEFDTLSDIARILSRVGGFEEKTAQVAERMAQAADADWVGLRIPDDYVSGLRLIASAGNASQQSPLPQVLPYDQGMSGRAYADENPIVAHDYPNHADALQHQVDAGEKSTLALPILFDGTAIGVFMFGSRNLGHFTDERVGLLEAVAYQLGPLLENAKLQQELAVTDEIARIITSTLDIGEVYERFVGEMKKLVDFERATILVVDNDAGVNVNKYEYGPHRPERRPGEVRPMKGSQLQHVLETGTALVRPDIGVDRRFPSDGEYLEMGLRSSIVLPLTSKSRVVGMLSLRSPSVDAYGAREQRILERLASQIAPAIENAQLYEERKKAEQEERQAARENSVMAEIGKVITSSLDINEIYGRLSDEVANLIPFDRISVTIIDPIHDVTRPTYIAGTDVAGRRPGDSIPLAGTLTEEVAGIRSPMMLVAEREDDIRRRFPGLVPAFRSGLRSFLAVPLIDHDVVIGVLQIRSKEPGVYCQRHLDLAERIGNQIAGAIANALLYEQTRQAEEAERLRSEELEVLFDVAGILAQAGSFDQKAASVMHKLAQFTGADWVTLRLPDQVTQGLRLVAAAGLAVQSSPPMPVLSNEETLAYTAFREGKPVVTNNYPAEPEASPNIVSLGMKSMMLIPIIVGGSTRGLVDVVSQKTGQFPPERVRLLTAIVDGMGGLIENARLDDERKRTAEHMHETARLASIGELAAGVAHEMNNPLTSVLGYSEMVLRSSIPEEYRKDIQTISDEAQRAAKIVQNLLFFARKGGTEKQYIDLNSIVNRALEMKSYDFKVSNITVNTQLSPEILRTMVDEHQLVQVLLNILTNAEQAIHGAGRNGHIDICTSGLGNQVEITIRDDGPGMTPEVLSKIFEPFFTTKEVGRGVGLGLSISYGIVKQHGGEVWAESSGADGTTFHITIPVVLPEEIAVSQAAPAPSAGKATRHLLVVDDEPYIRDLLRRYLEMERYTVDLAYDGQEAWRKMATMDYDCIILDLKMPGMSGPELYQRIQGLSEDLASKVVFISGDTVSSDTRDFVSQTGNPLITKPFSLDEMLRAVHELWERLPVTT